MPINAHCVYAIAPRFSTLYAFWISRCSIHLFVQLTLQESDRRCPSSFHNGGLSKIVTTRLCYTFTSTCPIRPSEQHLVFELDFFHKVLWSEVELFEHQKLLKLCHLQKHYQYCNALHAARSQTCIYSEGATETCSHFIHSLLSWEVLVIMRSMSLPLNFYGIRMRFFAKVAYSSSLC